jgi:predicted DCC family thiol-disulfide oxidoreductase YuxK
VPGATPPHVVLYDGTCGLCDRVVRFVLAHDRGGNFRFAPLQGRFAAAALERHGEDPARLDTFRVLCDAGTPSERVRSRGDATLFLLAQLPFPWRLAALLRVAPRPWVDAAYDAVARSRYRRFGRVDACRAPAPTERDLFVTD